MRFMSETGASRARPLAAAAVAAVAIVTAAGLYVFRSVRAVPSEALQGTRQVLQDARRIAQAFRTGSVTTTFLGYAAEISGESYLQFATLRELEIFEHKDELALFWGRLALPDVIVEARAPVVYTYYLDLRAPWRFALDGRTVRVAAPEIRFNPPAVDVSQLRYEVRKGSMLRDEASVLERLRQGLSELAEERARQHVFLVRETGRRKTEEFVEAWLRSRFEDAGAVHALVTFPDERVAPTPLP